MARKSSILDSEQLRPAIETITRVYATRSGTTLTPERKAKLLLPENVQQIYAILAKNLYSNLADEDNVNKIIDEIEALLAD